MAVGADAYRAGQAMADCPYKGPRNPDRWAWLAGWFDAKEAAQRPRSAERAEGSPQ